MGRDDENAALDANQNFKDVTLFGGFACGSGLLRGATAKDIALRVHPASRFGFVAEHL